MVLHAAELTLGSSVARKTLVTRMNPPPPNNVLPAILVVDDNELDVQLLECRFAEAGIKHPILAFRSGAAAIDFLTRTCAAPRFAPIPGPCLLLLDINMAPPNGFEVLAWARQQSALDDVMIVLLSGSDSTADVERGYALGADRHMLKYPVGEILTELVATAMRRRNLRAS
jgi:CheY-like chemotaxis protein